MKPRNFENAPLENKLLTKFTNGATVNIESTSHNENYGNFQIQNKIPLAVGHSIYFTNNTTLGIITSLNIHGNELIISTQKGTFKLKLIQPEQKEIPLQQIDSVITEKGSTYKYLPDGKTQRFKKVENKFYEPNSTLVYIPDWEWVQQNWEDLKKNIPPKVMNKIKDERTYKAVLRDYVYGDVTKCYIIDSQYNKLENNKTVQQAFKTNGIFLAFLSYDKIDFVLPITPNPKIGYTTYDSTKFKDPNTGKPMRSRHIGNKVIKIIPKT